MIKVLIIDNEAEFLDYLELIVKAKTHEAFTAKDTTAAIFLLEKEDPHLVFLDLLFLKTPSELLLFERIRKSSKRRKIYLTCGSDEIDQELSKQIGADGVIFKPFQMVEIGRLIDRICEELE